MLIDATGKLFGRWHLLDVATVAVLALVALGVLLVQSGMHRTSGEMVEGEGDIEYVIMLYNMKSLRTDLFQPGNNLSMTIRNQPRGDVSIVGSQWHPKVTGAMTPSGQWVEKPDPSFPNTYDVEVTLKDHALFTKDGYVTSGVKVKIGMVIEVEGYDYRLGGFIVDVHPTTNAQQSK